MSESLAGRGWRTQAALRYLVAALAALAFTLVYLNVCREVGRLAADLQYDDVGYAMDAATRLGGVQREGLGFLVRSFVSQPAHSFFTTLQGMAAFALAGVHDVALYASNGWILVAIALLVTAAFRRRPAGIVAIALAFTLTSPLAYFSIAEFRPDPALGLMTALMVWFYTSATFEGRPRRARIAGLIFGACLVIKPTFFAHSIAIAVGLVALSIAAGRLRRPAWVAPLRLPGREMALFLGLGIVVAAPFFALNGAHVLDYFWTNTRGANAHVWNYSDTLSEWEVLMRFKPYMFQLARYHWATSTAAAALFAFLCWRRNERAEALRIAIMMAIAAASAFVIVWGRAPTHFFFVTMHWLLMFAALYGFALWERQAAGASRRWALAAAAAAIVVLAFANSRVESRSPPPPEAVHGDSWNERVAQLIRGDVQRVRGPGYHPPIYVFTASAGPVNADALRWVAYLEGQEFLGGNFHLIEDPAVARLLADRHDYIVVHNDGVTAYDTFLPVSRIRPALLTYLMGQKRFEPLAPLDAKQNYYVFANRDNTRRFHQQDIVTVEGGALSRVSGLNGDEGPYPALKPPMPRIRWMQGREAQVCAVFPPGRPVDLALQFYARVPGRLLVRRDGAPLAELPLALDQSGRMNATIVPGEAATCIDLKVESPETIPPVYVAVTGLSLRPATK